MRVQLILLAFALCAMNASASAPIIQQVAQLASEYQHNLAGKVEDQTCGRGGECYDMRLQNVKGCTDGWALHGLWPQWSESCSREKFDYNEISDLADELKKYWPSCRGSSEEFWGHEWEKHGTCSGMSQHDYFSTALKLVQEYRNECESGDSCNVCFTKDLSQTEKCAS